MLIKVFIQGKEIIIKYNYIKNFGWLIKVFIEGQEIIIKYI